MELNKSLMKIQSLLDERDWSMYKLAKESGIPYSSLSTLFTKNHQPTLSTLEKICAGFQISMYEFFLDYPPYREETLKLDEQEIQLLKTYKKLKPTNKKLLIQIADLMMEQN